MRASRRGAWVESLECRRLFAFGASASVNPAVDQAPVWVAGVVPGVSASMDFASAGQTVSNAAGTVEVIFLRGDNTTGNVAVNYATANGTALAGTDYLSKSGTVTFGPFETTKSVFITLVDRVTAPALQQFTITLSSPSPGAYLGTTTTHTVTLQNDRAPVSIGASSYTKTTDDTGVDVVVTRGGNTDIAVSVGYQTSNITAVAGTDYTNTTGTLSFGVSETSKTVNVPLLGNRHAVNGVEFAFALLNPADGAVLSGTTSGTVTITNAYSPLQLDNATYVVTTDYTTLSVPVMRTGNTTGAATVSYATADGTALNGEDYLGVSGTLSFGAGEITKLIDIPLLGNVEAPGDFDFTLALSSPGGTGVIGTISSAAVTIENPYSPVRFAAAGYTVTTDDADARITVTRTGNLQVAATVDYVTGDLTAREGVDYDATTGALLFAAGEAIKTISVPLTGNRHAANGVNFNVTLIGGTGGAVIDSPANTIVTINNAHVPIQLDASSYDVSTDDATATLTVRRTGNTAGAVTVQYATSDASAVDGDDYTATSGTLSFAAGETIETIAVPLLGNFAAIDGAVFSVILSSPLGIGAELGAIDSATVTIENLHSVVSLDSATYVADVRDGTVTLTVVRMGNTNLAASVDFATADGTAVSGEDYFGASGTLAFGPGETTQLIEIALMGDAASPASLDFSLTLWAPGGNASIGAVSVATVEVENNQSLVQFAAGTYAVDADAGTVTLTVSRVGNTLLAASLDYATTDGTAAVGVDYTAASGTLSFLAGQTNKTISVPVHVNASGPAGVTFVVSLSNPTGAVIGAIASTVVTVQNFYAVVEFEATTATASGDGGSVSLLVSRTGNTALAGSVAYATFSETAVAGEDYTAASSVLVFAAGEVSKSITIGLPGNPLAPAARTFRVGISAGSGAAVVGAVDTTVVTVTNIRSVVSFAPTAYAVGESAGTVIVTLTRAGNLDRAVSIGYATADGTATAGGDYSAGSGTITFAAGQSTATFDVLVNSDLEFDPGETFAVSLTNPADGAVIGAAGSAVVTLSDTTPPPTFSGGGLVAAQRAGRLDAISLTFDQALESAPPDSAFTLYRRVSDRPGIATRLLPLAMNGTTYDPTTHAVTVRSLRRLKPGVFYQLVVNADGVRNQGGKQLDGAGTGQEGSPLIVTFGRGRVLKYVDHNGDTVKLKVKGPGVMELVRRPDGEGDRLTLVGATVATRLLGTVRPNLAGGDGRTTLDAVSSLGAATNWLTTGQFEVAEIN